MDWQPIIAIGAIITAFFTAWRYGISPFLQYLKKRKIEKALFKLREDYQEREG